MPRPRPELSRLPPVPHGGDAPEGCVDFSTGVSPLPPPEPIVTAWRSADVRRYPHPTALPLREAIARAPGLSPEQVVAGNGSAELIWALARAFGGPGRRVLVLTPAFGEYRQAALASGAEVDELRAAGPALTWDEATLTQAVRARAYGLVFICRPSNPCLSVLAPGALASAAAAAPDTLFVLDEAYALLWDDFVPARVSDNVAVLRSLTKVFALPGLRLGYLLAAPEVASAVQAALPPWNVSAPAIAGGLAALSLLPLVEEVRAHIRALRVRQRDVLCAAGAEIQAEGGTFLLCRTEDARGFCEAGLRAGIRLRDCTSFGLPNHIRVGVRREQDHGVLRSAWLRAKESVG